ncbi:hypothetical protein [Rickettsia endosymbiont of Gonocerus acuteangulatus]|uniref:hypothetical protein n=1 Tax=Rickettsia endosymbiont of Gonocerus acuteangulatus TaxID=3066266 RepID=UPI003132F1D2
MNQFQEQESYYSSYDSSHVRNKREDIDPPKHLAQYAPSNNSKLTLCYSKYAKNSYYTAMFYSEALHNIP